MNFCKVSIGNCSLVIDLLLESVIVKTVILNF